MAIVCLACAVSVGHAQTSKLRIEGEPFVFNELGAVIGKHEGTLQVDFLALQPDQREATYRETDLQQGDQIIMVNGKRAESTVDLKSVYENLKTGDKITLAIKRDKARMMVSFPKGDPEKQGARIMVRTAPEGADDATPLLPLGILVSESDGQVTVVDALPTPPGFPENIKFSPGDVISQLQGEPVESISDLEKRYSAIATGEEVEIEVIRDGGVDVFGFLKPELPEGRMMIKKQQ
jgi:S1-C subfamily serine protease